MEINNYFLEKSELIVGLVRSFFVLNHQGGVIMDNNTQKQQESYTSQSVIENGQPNAKSNSKKSYKKLLM